MGIVLHWQDAEVTWQAGAQLLAAGDQETIVARWRGADGQALGQDFPVDIPQSIPRETTDGAGGFRLEPVTPPLAIPFDPPNDARGLDLWRGQHVLARFALGTGIATPEPREPDERRTFPSDGGTIRLWVVAECFTEGENEAFFELVDGMRRYWIDHFLLFQNPRVREALTIEALYWHSPSGVGNLGTRFPSNPTDRIVQGEQATLESFLHFADVPIAERPFVLVLVKSDTVRGGAGGYVVGQTYAWQAAWATTKADPQEDWRAIALHELGHSFGLMDEYEAEYDFPVQPYEPNVSPVEPDDALPRPWSAMLTQGGDPLYEPLVDVKSQEVGRFLGARYSPNKYFRPSQTCLMRHIGDPDHPDDFCPVCAEVIARNLI